MVKLGKEQPFERGESGNRSYLDHEATTSIGGGSSLNHRAHDRIQEIISNLSIPDADEETILRKLRILKNLSEGRWD